MLKYPQLLIIMFSVLLSGSGIYVKYPQFSVLLSGSGIYVKVSSVVDYYVFSTVVREWNIRKVSSVFSPVVREWNIC